MGLGGLDDEFHHDQRSDGDDFIKVGAIDDLLLQRGGNNTLIAVGTVVGHNDKLIAAGAELILQDDQVLIAETDNAGNLGALGMQCLGDGQCDSTADAAADNADILQALNLGGFAQGADEVVDSLALFQRVQLHGAGTHHLEDDGNRTGLAVETGDGQGNALGIFLRADNDELTGLCLLCDQRCIDPKLGNSGVQLSPFHDSKQSSLSLP